ncbi:MAG TPA: ABC transporter permease [Thermoflexales bacterium]|nr:ABC transporter permease [Thermoflexales bacterium]
MPSTRSSPPWFLLPGILLVGLMAFPLAVVLWRGATDDFASAISQPAALAALRLSLLTSAISLSVTVTLGTPLAYGLAHWRFRGHGLVETLVDLPVVLPPAVAGLALLMAFGRRGALGPILGAVGVSLPFTTAAVVLAQIFVAAPFYIRAARISFAAIDPHYEEAAIVEGASAWQVFTWVMIPIAGRGLLSGMILMWARAMGEFGATILFAGNLEGVSQTMPLAIYLGFERDSSSALALAVVLILLSGGLMFALRKIEAGWQNDAAAQK